MSVEMTERGIGLEIIQRETTLILFEQLNDEILEQESKWIDRDLDWNIITGQDFEQTTLEQILPENFYPGHRPSLIEQLPKPNYPNVSVMAYSGKPSNRVVDQASNFLIGLDIEVMCKSERGESEVDRRIHRTVEAVHQVLVRNENLNRMSLGWENDPTVQITDIFKRREDKGAGQDWYWQAARIRYNLTRRSKLPE
jgi:hypothetical protein